MTREEAIDRLVELDVAKWGESEREASRSMHAKRSHGLAVNGLGAKLALSDNADEQAEGERLMREAKPLLTDADWRILRQGG